jgi:hypothetical protein
VSSRDFGRILSLRSGGGSRNIQFGLRLSY